MSQLRVTVEVTRDKVTVTIPVPGGKSITKVMRRGRGEDNNDMSGAAFTDVDISDDDDELRNALNDLQDKACNVADILADMADA